MKQGRACFNCLNTPGFFSFFVILFFHKIDFVMAKNIKPLFVDVTHYRSNSKVVSSVIQTQHYILQNIKLVKNGAVLSNGLPQNVRQASSLNKFRAS